MTHDPVRELTDLTVVHAFYVQTLQAKLGHPIPIPAGLTQVNQAAGDPERLNAVLNIARRWLNVLDMAIGPPLVREALRGPSNVATGEALLRYYVFKPHHIATDRDKADLVASFLYRHRTSQTRPASSDVDGVSVSFEADIYKVLGGEELTLPEEHRQLANEFRFIRTEVEDIRHFDELMDSGIMDRVRELKARFGKSFFHPRVLACVAEYNSFFGARFDELFREAARQIKTFAHRVQEEGGSVLSRVEGDISVKNLAEIEESSMLEQEYDRAKVSFHKISKYKKVVDSRHKPEAPRAAAAGAAAPPAPPPAHRMSVVAAGPARITTNLVEEGKLKGMDDTIHSFVHASEVKGITVIPLRNCNVPVTPAEVESFRAQVAGEKSFRADYATVHRRIVAVHARMLTELEEFKDKEGSAYLWKPHADSLAFLLTAAQHVVDDSAPVLEVAGQRGLTEKIAALNFSLQKLKGEMQRAITTLEGLAPHKAP